MRRIAKREEVNKMGGKNYPRRVYELIDELLTSDVDAECRAAVSLIKENTDFSLPETAFYHLRERFSKHGTCKPRADKKSKATSKAYPLKVYRTFDRVFGANTHAVESEVVSRVEESTGFRIKSGTYPGFKSRFLKYGTSVPRKPSGTLKPEKTVVTRQPIEHFITQEKAWNDVREIVKENERLASQVAVLKAVVVELSGDKSELKKRYEELQKKYEEKLVYKIALEHGDINPPLGSHR